MANQLAPDLVEAVRGQLEKVLSSPQFARADRSRRFVQYVVEQVLAGNGEQLKETVIGAAVFKRPADYDPRNDSIVRMEAGKLRVRLKEHYLGAGKADPILIDLPKGSYVPALLQVQSNGAVPVVATARSRRLWLVLAATLASVLLAAILWKLRPAPISSIAVLPLVNLSPDPDTEYFGDGLSEEIIHLLANTEGLSVISQTSSFALKSKGLNVRQIGAQLKVGAVVEGSVRKEGSRMRITAQLIPASDDRHLWSGEFERDVKDAFTVQTEIADEIVHRLQPRLQARPLHATRRPPDPEAYQLYLQGRYFLNKWSLEGARKSVTYLERAAAKDPNFAPIYASLSHAHFHLGWLEAAPKVESYV
jgi:adenylate cyclase